MKYVLYNSQVYVVMDENDEYIMICNTEDENDCLRVRKENVKEY